MSEAPSLWRFLAASPGLPSSTDAHARRAGPPAQSLGKREDLPQVIQQPVGTLTSQGGRNPEEPRAPEGWAGSPPEGRHSAGPGHGNPTPPQWGHDTSLPLFLLPSQPILLCPCPTGRPSSSLDFRSSMNQEPHGLGAQQSTRGHSMAPWLCSLSLLPAWPKPRPAQPSPPRKPIYLKREVPSVGKAPWCMSGPSLVCSQQSDTICVRSDVPIAVLQAMHWADWRSADQRTPPPAQM